MSEVELQDAILRHSLQILRLSAGEQAAIDEIMRQLQRDLRDLLATSGVSGDNRRAIERLLKDAEKVIDPAYAAAAKSVDTRQLALIVAEHTVELLEDIAPSIKLPTKETLDSLTKDILIEGAPSSKWWERQAEDTKLKFEQNVRQGVIAGETNEKIVSRIMPLFGNDRAPGILRRNARGLVQSSVMTAANQARLATFRKNSRMFKGVRWLATLDGLVCNRCAALDGQAWDLDGKKLAGTEVDFLAPPIHWNDRCVLSPIPHTDALDEVFPGISDKFAAVSQRASANGPVHGATTFNDFAKRQGPEWMEKTFGKGRAELLAAGRITVRDLVNGFGRELTLSELRAR